MITPAQYWISGGNFGGGLGRSVSVELGLKVNLSTSEKTFVCRVLLGAVVEDEADGAGGGKMEAAFSFSFPRPAALANALKNP
jgi:hypothetical protein